MPRSYESHVLEKRPVGFWRLNERAKPTAHDATHYRRDGTYHGGVTFGGPGPFHSEPSLAVGLNGLDAYVEVPNSDAFSQPTSGKGLTVEVWFRPDTISFDGQTSEHYIHWLGKGETDDYEWGLRFYSDAPPRNNRVSAYIWNPTNEVAGQKENLGAGAYFQDPVTVGAWIYVVACYDPGDASNPNAGVSIYKNGVFREGPLTSPGARYSQFAIHPVHGAAPVRFGTRDLGSFLRGGLADVAIYPRVLRADEVMDNFRSAGSVQRLGG